MIRTAVLMCHAPIVIPAIGGARAHQCAATTRAMQRVARHLVRSAPDVLVVLSPHAPRDRHRFSIAQVKTLELGFAAFGFPELAVCLPGAAEAASALTVAAREQGLDTRELPVDAADHGAAVPLHFLVEAGFRGPTLLVALPYPGTGSERAFGDAIRRAAAARRESWSILASGDLSHRLLPGAPAGYDPRARSFDLAFVERLARGQLEAACSIDPALCELAAEDAVASTTVAAAAVEFAPRGHELFSYEGPFGVGYAEAVLFDADAPPMTLIDIARDAVRAQLEGAQYTPPTLPAPWTEARAVFVTLRRANGELRGCIGRLEPSEETLAQEVVAAARAAATTDPRFAPVTLQELPGLRFEVSVLDPPEPVASTRELDPAEFGVVVRCGARRGVLLPQVAGIETVEEQVSIARSKGNIQPGEPVELERFRVRKVVELD